MSIVITTAGIVIMFMVSLFFGFILNEIIKWIRLRLFSSIVALFVLLNVTDVTHDWYFLFFLGIIIMTVWAVIRTLYMKVVARKISYADEQLDHVWASLYAIYLLYAALQRSFPYDWLQDKLNASPNAAVVTLAGSGMSALLLLTSLSAMIRPYKQLKRRFNKQQAPIEEKSLETIIRITDSKRRGEAVGYVMALVERMIIRKKIVRVERGGKRYLVKRGSRSTTDEQRPELTKLEQASSPVRVSDLAYSEIDQAVSVLSGSRSASMESLAEGHAAASVSIEASGEIDPPFRLLRQDFKKHPISEAPYESRLHYMMVLFYGVEDLKREHRVVDSLLDQYAAMFVIRQEDAEPIRSFNSSTSPPELGQALRTVKKTRWRKRQGLFYNRYSYKHAVFGEFLYTRQWLSGRKAEEEVAHLYGQSLGISPSDRKSMIDYCALLREGEMKAAQLQLYSQMSRKMRESLGFLYQRAVDDRSMGNKSRFETAVVATMSAGKSTFLNALAGMDLLPSKNQACTAKITKLVHNAGMRHAIGYSRTAAGDCDYSGFVDESQTTRWNGIGGSNEVYLEASLAGSYSADYAVSFYDTPGTNYSMDGSHNEVTYRFLKEQTIDLIVYLINATQISTDDNSVLLHKVTDSMKTGGPQPTNIVFLLNKADEFDLEGDDDLEASVSSVCRDLAQAGFDKPAIVPVSSYGAKLFRMALAGRQISKKEMKDMDALYRLFIEDGVDLTQYARIPDLAQVTDSEAYPAAYPALVAIGEKQYRGSDLLQALQRTGILAVEAYINQLAYKQGGKRSNG
ncbi:dynamin family protein [Paenibacillus mendelii]|uniref:Dynamin family protein n=1 Tax=Paenibacillus mendelii TaxID=206163 RepID=A0ABV6JI66_9BACL|nr:dynamin family protein [Paenibacillus mendelii]MCQ6558484.1 dynamin family protein [Paenibacillus mendelii]